MADQSEFIYALQQLANNWVMKARDHARESKTLTASNPQAATYHRGIAETYHKLALELAELIKQGPAQRPVGSSEETEPIPPPPTRSAPLAPPEPVATYTRLDVNEVVRILDYAGLTPRDVHVDKDNVFTAVFSRWQPYSEQERLQKIRAADFRIDIVRTGKLRDTMDPYVEFGFKE